jgi:adenylate cyclase
LRGAQASGYDARMRLPAWLAPLIVLLGALQLRIADPKLVENLRHATFDEYQRLKPAPWQDAGVRIVDIDDETLARHGQWPWPRTLTAELLERLGDAGVAVVAFDVVFAEPDRTSPRSLLEIWRRQGDVSGVEPTLARLPDHDAVLARSFAKVPTVLGFPLLDEPGGRKPLAKWGMSHAGDDPIAFLRRHPGAVPNLGDFEAAAGGQGSFATGDADRDGIIRRAPLLFAVAAAGEAPTIYPALSLEAVRLAQNASTYVIRSSNASGETAFGERTGINLVRVGRMIAPTDRQGALWLRDTGPVAERVVPAWKAMAADLPRSALADTIVFIGTSAKGLRDIRALPLNPAAAGVEVHARVTEQMLLGEFLERPDWIAGAELAWLVLLGGAMILLLPRLGPVWSAVIGGVGLAATFLVSWLAFDWIGWLVDPVYPALAAIALYITGSLIAYLRTEKQRQQVRTAMSRYTSPELTELLARNPDRLKLGGETREMTIMFSDIRGFTSRTEKMTAEQVTRFINRFLTPMTTIIRAHKGTIDKYMGDAIMAFWNAPADDADHRRNAGHAALAMIDELARLNAALKAEAEQLGERFEPLLVGIGLNSGLCSVGNMGSEQRFDYSVIGDDVNLASRLEGRSKVYGMTIVIGEKTATGLSDLALLELDLVRVKGKAKPVTVYTIWGGSDVATSASFASLREAHARGLSCYRAQDWSGATAAFALARSLGDGRLEALYSMYAERIATYRAAPPPRDWDGVETATEK